MKFSFKKHLEPKLLIYLTCCSFLTLSLTSMAQVAEKKPLRVNFNEMIDSTSREAKHLHRQVKEHYQQKDEALLSKEEKQRVTDLVDVEIGWGETPTLVDRRFDSVSDPAVSN